MENELVLSVADSAGGLPDLRDEWNRLLDASRAPALCLRWEWLSTWWDVYRDSGMSPRVLLVRDGGRLVGLAPFYLRVEPCSGLSGVRTLRFLGTGEPEHEEVASEYLDIIAHKGYEGRVARAVWEHLRHREAWDRLVFNDVLEDSLILTSLRRTLAPAGVGMDLERVGVRYSIRLPATWQEYIAMLDEGAARRLPYKRRKIERAGRVEYRRVSAPEDLDRAFEELIRLHALRWQAQGREGVFASPRFTEFHRRLARILLPQGMLGLGLLSLDGTNIAAHYNLRYAGTEYFYQGGNDVGRASRYSPGVVAHVRAIESAILDGLGRYDFMKGGTASYKSEFGCEETPMYDVRVFAGTLRGRWLAIGNRARACWRRLRHGRGAHAAPA